MIEIVQFAANHGIGKVQTIFVQVALEIHNYIPWTASQSTALLIDTEN